MTKKKGATEDIKPAWLNPIRAAQAACRHNKGYAVVTIKVLVNKNDPVLWVEPDLKKIHPAKLSEYSVSPSLLAIMLEIADKKVDNKVGGT